MNIPKYEAALKSALAAGMNRDDAHEAALQATRQQAQPAAAKHTPAPWAVSMPGGQTTFNGRRVTVTSRGNMVADLDWNSPAENLANARLIAAAPALLQALKACKAAVENGELPPSARMELVRDYATPAIALASQGDK